MTEPLTDPEEDADIDTDRGGHGPVPPPLDLLESMMRKVVGEIVKGLQEDLTAHNIEEIDHHRAVYARLELLVADKREQGERISLLEQRVGRLDTRVDQLEARAPTEPPEPEAAE